MDPMLTIDRAFVISLPRQHARLACFDSDLSPVVASGFCPRPKVVQAVDGKLTGCPERWVYRAVGPGVGPTGTFYRGLGAWGCYRSHLAIIELLLNQQAFGPTLIFEDDAFAVDGFADLASAFTGRVPEDWDSLFLGGEHLCPPLHVDDCVWRCVNTSRSHAYVVRGEQFLRRLYERLGDWRAWPDNAFADHSMTSLQLDGRWNIYAPKRWLFGQRGGYSECVLDAVPERTWQ